MITAMPAIKSSVNKTRKATQTFRLIKMRAHLNADTLYDRIRKDFAKAKDHRASNTKIPLTDALMSGFAMFFLKDPSLLIVAP